MIAKDKGKATVHGAIRDPVITHSAGAMKPVAIKLISKPADFGRFFGASAIFYYHIGLVTGYPFSSWGEYAVAFFIILSGISYSCFSSIRPTDLPSYKQYVVARLTAIFPIFVCINIMIFAGSFIYPSSLGRPFNVVEFFLSATGLSQYFGCRYLSKVMWFIPFILQAYFFFPVIDRVLNRVSGKWVVIAAFFTSLLFIELTFYYYPSRATEICRDWSILYRLPEVCIGVIVGRAFFCRRDFRDGLSALVAFAILAFLLAVVASPHFMRQAYILSLPWRGLLVTVIITFIAIAATVVAGSTLNIKLLRLAGTASFPFYLAHGIAIKFIYHYFGNILTAWIIYFLLCWGAAAGFIYVLPHASARIWTKRQTT